MPSDFTPNNVWGSTAPTGETQELTLGSGQTCLARRLSIEGMIKGGMLAEADALTAQVQKHVKKVKSRGPKNAPRTEAQEIDQVSLLKDPAGLTAMVTLLDKACPHIVVSPVVKLHYTEHTVGKTTVTKLIPPEDRQEGVVYTDQIDFADKAELFDWAAGGLAALMQFRQ